MKNPDFSNHNPAHGMGGQFGQEDDMPGFLADKLGVVTEEAAPGSYADIQARLATSRRRGGFWLWATGALLLGGLLLGLLYKNMVRANSATTIAIQESKTSLPKATKNRPERTRPVQAQAVPNDDKIAQTSRLAAIASKPNSGSERLETGDLNRSALADKQALPKQGSLSRIPAQALRAKSRALPAVAIGEANTRFPARMYAGVSLVDASSESERSNLASVSPAIQLDTKHYLQSKVIGINAPAWLPIKGRASEIVLAHLQLAATSRPSTAVEAMAKVAASEDGRLPKQLESVSSNTLPPLSPVADEDIASSPAPIEWEASNSKAPSLSARQRSSTIDKPTSEYGTQNNSKPLTSSIPTSGQEVQPLPIKSVSTTQADSALASPVGISPTAPDHKPSKWHFAFGSGAGIFNRQALVRNSLQKDFEPTGLRSGLAFSLHGSARYRLRSNLYADFNLGLLHGQATLRQIHYSSGGGFSYQAIANGFMGTPLAPTRTVDGHLAYTMVRLQAGIAWQPNQHWYATLKGGVQQTLQQQTPYKEMRIPTISFPVGAAIMLKLIGPIWAGAEVTYFGSGPGQKNSATLLMLEYRR